MAEATQQSRHVQLVLLNVCLGQFITALNNRAIIIALPTLTDVFGTTLTTIQWTILLYDLVFIGIVLTVGRMGDLFGRKRIYVSGFVFFVVASVLCGLAQTSTQLILFRGIQAIGGAMITGNGRALLTSVYPVDQRGRAMGLASTAFHVGFLTGPTLGGFLIDAVDWRWIFFLNVPPGLLAAYMGGKILKPEQRVPGKVDIDASGALLLLVGNAAFLYSVSRVPEWGITDLQFGLFMATAVGTLGLFIWNELRAKLPLLSLALFRNRVFAVANISFFVVAITQSGVSFLFPFYLQGLMGFSPSEMGWIIISNSVVIIVVAPIAGWLSDKLGSRLLCTVGTGLIVVGYALLATLELTSGIPRIVMPLLISGFGWAIFNAPNLSAIFGAVSHDQLGAASGVNLTMNRVGNAVGVALAGALFTTYLVDAGVSPTLLHSPQSWGTQPAVFLAAFEGTVRMLLWSALLATVTSALMSKKKSPA